MKTLLLFLALTNMPPPPPNTCPGQAVGTACNTPRRTNGVCVQGQCPKTEFSAKGSKTVMVDCMKCEDPPADAGTR